SVPASSVPAAGILAFSIPTSSAPGSCVPADGVLTSSVDSAGFGNPAASESVPAIFNTDHADHSTLPPEPSSVAKAPEDPDWFASMQEEMQ
nr:hypothetical protein [Tanacetum cinerariifolium]